MLPTHALVGLALAVPVATIAPEHATVAYGGALLGSIIPDIDMYAGHRRTLHYPTGYTVAAIVIGVVAVLVGTSTPVGLAMVLIGLAVHCRMDRYGGGLELRPWEGKSDRAVFDHVRNRWRAPKRWVRYDGAPEDVVLASILSGSLLIVLEGSTRWLVVAIWTVGFTYGLLRRRLADLAPAVFTRVPDTIAPFVPDRYRE